MNMVKKPSWFVDRNANGTVPVIEHDDGRTLFDSLVICDYLDTIYPENRLNPSDAYLKAKHQLIVEVFSKVTAAYYKALRTTNPEGSAADLNKAFEGFEKLLAGKFFAGKLFFF